MKKYLFFVVAIVVALAGSLVLTSLSAIGACNQLPVTYELTDGGCISASCVFSDGISCVGTMVAPGYCWTRPYTYNHQCRTYSTELLVNKCHCEGWTCDGPYGSIVDTLDAEFATSCNPE